MSSGRSCIQFLAIVIAAVAAGPAGPHAQAPERTLEVRSGTLRLTPLGPSSGERALFPSTDPVHNGERNGVPGRDPITAGQTPRAIIGGEQMHAPLSEEWIGKTIGAADEIIVEFESPVTRAQHHALDARGIKLLGRIETNVYRATTTQPTLDHLDRAARDINPIVATGQLQPRPVVHPELAREQESAHRDSGRSSARTGTTGEGLTVRVVLKEGTDRVVALRELKRFGEIKAAELVDGSIEVELKGGSVPPELAALVSIKFIDPVPKPVAHNVMVRERIGMSADPAQPPEGLTGRGVRVGIWDRGHVAITHQSFQGRLLAGAPNEPLSPDHHATHVAGTLAGSGVARTAMVASGGKQLESEVPAIGDLVDRPADPPPPAADPGAAQDACIALGPGLPRPQARIYPGIAPGAEIESRDFDNVIHELVDVLRKNPGTTLNIQHSQGLARKVVDVANNSWGFEPDSPSEAQCRRLGSAGYPTWTEAATFNAIAHGRYLGEPIRRIPIVFSGGNFRCKTFCNRFTSPPFENYGTVLPPGTAKGVITVGAIDGDTLAITIFSGFGPTVDGRIKPDVVAPGCRSLGGGSVGIISARVEESWGRMCGTSMAAPVVTGMIALMMEKLTGQGEDLQQIFPSTYKALLIHAAEALGREGPGFEYGYGRVRVPETLALLAKGTAPLAFPSGRYFEQGSIGDEAQPDVRTLRVPAGMAEFKVTLAWDDDVEIDKPKQELVNDLDLVLVSPAPARERRLPWVLDPNPGREKEAARPGEDRVNVVEQVVVKQPSAGDWRIEVRAKRLNPFNAMAQSYSLVASVR